MTQENVGMAMNKKEREELEQLRREVRIAKALRFTEEVKPDLDPPDSFRDIVKGYQFVGHISESARVDIACTDTVGHGFGQHKTSSRGSWALYSTRLLALRGLRHSIERQVAKVLADIDVQIEAESAK